MLWFILCVAFVFVNAQYEVPDATIEILKPKGFKVSIPDEEGIKLFAFHGKINEELNGREGGTFSRDILKPINGRWTFHEPYIKLKNGDVLYYWTYVDYFNGINKLGYTKDDQKFVVKDEVNEQPPTLDKDKKSCATTEANVNRKKCTGDLIFSDEFSEATLNNQFWTIEQKYADAPDYEFVMYMSNSKTLQFTNGIIKLKPILSEDHFGNEFLTSSTGFDFGQRCTSPGGSTACHRKHDAGFILPPVISSQISSKDKFSFKYGKIEIRAKLPKGDWIYPQLYLNPLLEEYGSNYESGQIRIAFSPGNKNLNQLLQGGLIFGSSRVGRTIGMKSIRAQNKNWSDDFHKFTVIWKPDSIILGVDDRMYGSIFPPSDGFSRLVSGEHTSRWKSGSVMAPFDKEMYLIIGLGVGGFNFDDTNDGTKPWVNGERLSLKKFYNASHQWKNTWGENAALEVDYVKVWAV